MKTLATCNSISGNNTALLYFSASSLKAHLLSGGPEFISYRKRPLKLVSSGLQHFVPLRRGSIDFISCFSSQPQADTQNNAVENQDTNQSKTVHVKFLLQKECTFGEHFCIVGDDPIFGSWDVTNAIPLNWADGHQWAAELDIPVGKAIQFKFVLQGKTGDVVWQPDPNRTFQPWETANTIIISEDWDSAELRVLSEEERIVIQDGDSPIVPDEEQIHNTNKGKSWVESNRELTNGSVNISALEENGSYVSASKENAEDIVQSDTNQIENDMVQNDLTWTWSHIAVKKFLSSLKLL